MSIPAPLDRSKQLLGRIRGEYLILAILILSSTAAFGLGMLAGREGAHGSSGIGETGGIFIEDLKAGAQTGGPAAAAIAAVPLKEPLGTEPAPATVTAAEGKYMASKSGEKYYLPTCGSAKRIKEENRIYFKTKADAEAAGYGPAANCPGL